MNKKRLLMLMGSGKNIKSGLVVYWKLNETSAGTESIARVDATGNGNNLTDVGFVPSVTAIIDNGASFALNAAKYLKIVTNAFLTHSHSFTYAFWATLTNKDNITGALNKWTSSPTAQREINIDYISGAGEDKWQFQISSTGAGGYVTLRTDAGIPTLGRQLVIAWHDAIAKTINICVNNGTVFSAAAANGVYSGTGDLRIGNGSYDGSYQNPFNGIITEVGKWNRVLSAKERTELYSQGMGTTYPFRTQINLVCDGDSNTLGAYGATPYPTVLSAALPTNIMANLGASGQRITTMDGATAIARYDSSRARNIWVIMGGTNDFFYGEADAATVYAKYISLSATIRAAGFNKIVWIDVLPCTAATKHVDFDTNQAGLQTLMVADHSDCDYFVDAAANANLANADDTTYYHADKVHLNSAGYAVLAGLVKIGILTL
jgi:lysophospholipase L1-like esterase